MVIAGPSTSSITLRDAVKRHPRSSACRLSLCSMAPRRDCKQALPRPPPSTSISKRSYVSGPQASHLQAFRSMARPHHRTTYSLIASTSKPRQHRSTAYLICKFTTVPRARSKSTRASVDRRVKSRERFTEALEEYHAALQAQARAAPTDPASQSRVRWVDRMKTLWEGSSERARQAQEEADEDEDDEEYYNDPAHRIHPSTRPQANRFPSASSSSSTAGKAAAAVSSAAASMSEQASDFFSMRVSNTWTFAHQKIRFPVDKDWPPPLPGVPGTSNAEVAGTSEADTSAVPASLSSAQAPRAAPVSALYPHPITTSTPALPPLGPRSPRDLAALALDVHRFASRPLQQVVRKGTHKSPAAPLSKSLRRQLRELPGSDETFHVAWRGGVGTDETESAALEGLAPADSGGTFFWLAERNTRLEFLGDALAREIASRIVYHSFPDLASGGISTAASHLTTNDTFGFLYELSGMENMRVGLARELLGEAVERERQRVGALEARKGLSEETTEILEVDLQDLDQAGKADRFEAYLAFVRLTHGPLVAEAWFSSLLRPWVERIASDPGFHTTRNISVAAQLRRRAEEKRIEVLEAEETRQREERDRKRYSESRWGSLAIAGKGLLSRLLGREAKGRDASRDRSREK
ncbi:hypothetical protein BCV69DRAFT_188589 [Microstroma glucosiphilum]|uniref:RNase III domain-containing protein n=1 Tax=Pseudomicrostroma glucosiphilum TaxID=1684307 RepID=A0A316U7D8_9BASI|nr:hypothetical protein BCV69DRAFT_188589 [Pseudomicrostroma glucosiphilum]PWN21150.1 hypothetical protein BCV69DRAFT_188589 [Pseudomicrostroma glucosiphilum]